MRLIRRAYLRGLSDCEGSAYRPIQPCGILGDPSQSLTTLRCPKDSRPFFFFLFLSPPPRERGETDKREREGERRSEEE